MLHLLKKIHQTHKYTQADINSLCASLFLSSSHQAANIPGKSFETDVSMTTDKHHGCQVTACIHGNLVCCGI